MSDARIAISEVEPGFTDPVHDTQRVFRALLAAISQPGTIEAIEAPRGPAPLRARAEPAAFASLLALCDYSTPVFLAPADPALAAALRFHTGAPQVDEPGDAAFAYVHDAADLPALDRLACGAPESPETAVTLFVRVSAFTGGERRVLSGPGIRGTAEIAPAGLPPRFWHERARMAARFPCGIDSYLVCGDQLLALPRTTLAEVG